MMRITLTALAMLCACGSDEATPPSSSTAGSGGSGGEGGRGPCGATADSDDPTFRALIDFTDTWRKELDIPGLVLGVSLDHGATEHIAALGVREKGGCEPITADTLFDDNSSAWIAKDLAALVAVDKGEMSLDAPITEVVPGFSVATGPHGSADSITLRHLLDHSAGLLEGHFGSQDDPCVAGASLADYIEGHDPFVLHFPPGAHWGYSAAGSALVGLAVERASGMVFADAVATYVFEPLGMDATYDTAEAMVRDYAVPHPAADSLICQAEQPVDGLFVNIRDRLRLLRQVSRSELVAADTWNALYAGTPPSVEASAALLSGYLGDATLSLRKFRAVGNYISGSNGYNGCALVEQTSWPLGEPDVVVTAMWNQETPLFQAPCEKALELFRDITLGSYQQATDPASWAEYVGVYSDLGAEGEPQQLEIQLVGNELRAVTGARTFPLTPDTVFYWLEDSALQRSTDRDLFALAGLAYVRFYRDPVTGLPDALGGTAWTTIGPHLFRQ